VRDKDLIETETDWREQIEHHQTALDEVLNQLVEAEEQLAERLAAIAAFEFKLRARIGRLTQRLDNLDAEIKEYRRQLSWLNDDWEAAAEEIDFWSMGRDDAAAGEHNGFPEEAPAAPSSLNEDERKEIKQLFRQLARRFHPDMAVDAADREYRTQMMAAINAAYAAGDLEKLQQLALEPDAADLVEYAQTDQQLAEALAREIERCRRRLAEIRQELAHLEQHQSTRLLRRAQQAEAEGRDLLAEMARRLEEQITQKMVERDVLQSELENLDAQDATFHDKDLADLIWDVSLDQAYDDDLSSEYERWLRKQRHRYDEDEDILDDLE
jgi:septal ring factor EnvC (AmiA/AmiB activator)